MVLAARVQAGWIDQADLVAENPVEDENSAENEKTDDLDVDTL